MRELLRLEQVSYRYEDKYIGLKGVSATFYAGERVAVLGGNGAGKSTFFLCCNGVLKPEQGKIFLKGHEVSGSRRDMAVLRQMVGLVFQDPDNQIIAGTVEDEVSFGPMNLRLPAEEVKKRISRSLEQMDLSGYQSRAPQYLSGGEKKRVSIADILAMHPEVILLDEPTASLDPKNVALLERILAQLSAEGVTLVVSTHDVDFAYRFAERIIVFNGGEIMMDAKADEVFSAENILSKAGLQKPLLYAAAEFLEKRFPNRNAKKPKTLEELKWYIEEIEGR